jgi:hypothetical protein
MVAGVMLLQEQALGGATKQNTSSMDGAFCLAPFSQARTVVFMSNREY